MDFDFLVVGAGVAVEIANTHPDRVEKVVLVNCPFSPERGRTAVHVKEGDVVGPRVPILQID